MIYLRGLCFLAGIVGAYRWWRYSDPVAVLLLALYCGFHVVIDAEWYWRLADLAAFWVWTYEWSVRDRVRADG